MKVLDIRGEIISTARITVQSEKRNELCLTIPSLLDRIIDERGCRNYSFYNDAKNKDSFILVGEWISQDAWDRHLKSDNFAILLGSLKLLCNTPEVNFQVLSHESGIEEVTRARCSSTWIGGERSPVIEDTASCGEYGD